ncbi:MAG TPA: hypothetical protein DDY78_13800 [Planctomycetales bacterium]|jgi:hypothetical protein|nr:hypothetical protein [Planctomycetales bacterium]
MVTRFTSDMTLRWACRAGDFVLWARFRGLSAPSGREYDLADVWELRDGNHLTVTNRLADLPEGFDLHPLEVSGALAAWMQRRLSAGHTPTEPVLGPNLWRILAGDRLAWVGRKRPGVDSSDGVLAVIEFRVNALVYGEPIEYSELGSAFGGFDAGEQSLEAAKLCKSGWDAVQRVGLPRVAAADDRWCIG